MRNAIRILLSSALLGLATAQADTLIIQGIDQARASDADRPSRGMSMSAVSAKWGEPSAKMPAVGQPPITRWEYPGFMVYFEYDHVIDSVIRRP